MSTLLQKVQSGELTPIIYMPMTDAATCHVNYGTGGNFTLNGTIATSERGANQDNCVASYFDGTADYLSRTSLTGIADGKQVVVSGTAKSDGTTTILLLELAETSNLRFVALVDIASSGMVQFRVMGYNSSNTLILRGQTGYIIPINSTFSYSFSCDLTDTNKRIIKINGITITPTWSVYTNTDINFLQVDEVRIGRDNPTTYGKGNIGELYFNTTYIDLATNNPFWDKDTNKPKPVRQVIRETGVTPLIAMPLDASNAGKNYGTGGDFTVNSGPYVGARGASEWWQRTAKFDGSTSYLSSTGLTGITDSKTLTMVAHVYKTASTLYRIVGSTNSNVSISINASNQLIITAKNSAGTTILSATVTTTIANTAWTSILVSIDLNNTANRSVYLNGVLASVTWATYTNDLIDFTNASWIVGADVALGNKYNGTLSLMLDNTYVDFTSETNRLKYIDGLSYPININNQVLEGKITKPALYLAFEDTANLGLNSGYGGNLNVNGTLVAGADVLG